MQEKTNGYYYIFEIFVEYGQKAGAVGCAGAAYQTSVINDSNVEETETGFG